MSDVQTIVLAYRRVAGDLSTGSILLVEGSSPPQVLLPFESSSFIAMMRDFAHYLMKYPSAGGAIQRTDRPGLVQIDLRPEEVEHFRVDPAEAIRQRIVPPQRVVIGIDKSTGPDQTAVALVNDQGSVLETGYAALAECFGDVVYGRVRTKQSVPEIECLCCGAWAKIERAYGKVSYKVSYTCWECNQQLSVADLALDSGWAGVRVTDLLNRTGREKFFLPRRWNNNRNWITSSDLERLYNAYNKEKMS